MKNYWLDRHEKRKKAAKIASLLKNSIYVRKPIPRKIRVTSWQPKKDSKTQP